MKVQKGCASKARPIYLVNTYNDLDLMKLTIDLFTTVHIDVMEILTSTIYNYSLGRFDLVKQELTMKRFNELSATLLEKNYTEGSNSAKSKEFLQRTLEGLQQSILQHLHCEATQTKLDAALERASILDDIAKLKEYLESLKNTHLIFDEIQVTTSTTILLKPQYQVYIERHGVPEAGVFESEKLAIIIKELIGEGVITPAQVFDEY